MVVRKYVIPVLAVAGGALALYTMRAENRPITPAQPVAEPARPSFAAPVAGAGIIEASTENIAIGTHLPGVVTQVHVRVGEEVKAGDPLFTIDERAARAELEVRKGALRAAEQTLTRLKNSPRPEDVPPAQAKVEEAQAQMNDAQTQLTLWESVSDARAVSVDELNKRRYALDSARARLAQAAAELDRLKAGAWKEDIAIAEAEAASASAQVQAAQTELDRLTVRAPVDGQVLQVNIRRGEFAQPGPLPTPLMLLGDTRTLHIRVDVDENDAWRIRPDSRATASLRGNSSLKTDLSFVRIEPYVVPKRSLTGDATERVDTRVLQVLYSFPRGRLPAYVGQQMDVFIEAGVGAGGDAPETSR
jgi:multidrug resistance efflux pump